MQENALEVRVRHKVPCALPDSLLWQLEGGQRGVVRLALSPSETRLAAALAGNSTFEIRIFDLTTGRVHATCAGVHDAFVYDLCWHAFERGGAHPLVISCGGGVVQLFEVPEDAACIRDPVRLHARIHMPSHVYSVRPHPLSDPKHLVLVCGGHDFGLILCQVSRCRQPEGWVAGTPQLQEVSSQADILCVRFSSPALDNLYASDNAGNVLLFQVCLHLTDGNIRATYMRTYSSRDLLQVPIYSFDVVTRPLLQSRRVSQALAATVDDWVMLFGRDSRIRLAVLQHGMLRVELLLDVETWSFPVRGVMSPDGMYVAAGSVTGELLLWSAEDGKRLPAGQVQLSGPIMDVVWSDRYHLLACCAFDDEAPPVLVVVSDETEKPLPPSVPPQEPPPPDNSSPKPRSQPLATETAASSAPLAIEDMRYDCVQLVPLTAASTATRGEWVPRWVNSDCNPRSAISSEERRKMKERILSDVLELKAVNLEEPVGEVNSVPGGIV